MATTRFICLHRIKLLKFKLDFVSLMIMGVYSLIILIAIFIKKKLFSFLSALNNARVCRSPVFLFNLNYPYMKNKILLFVAIGFGAAWASGTALLYQLM